MKRNLKRIGKSMTKEKEKRDREKKEKARTKREKKGREKKKIFGVNLERLVVHMTFSPRADVS